MAENTIMRSRVPSSGLPSISHPLMRPHSTFSLSTPSTTPGGTNVTMLVA
ncbi:Uncharacterised protein [Bordetella pertussis]|nr:Uncharacterised protein [Bordetella pertussis]CPK77310.1 Uncharacterised protein [Bordetella pertussis]CPL57149.1 Uncharacterised protein [Bordetella pertussis]CPM38577.1 Uncharacterised protein [Bordetella pertussis]CPO15037.1 Uncharacterised protein [Bordetella pertussis]